MINTKLKNVVINSLLNSKIGFKALNKDFENIILTYHGVSNQKCNFNSRHIETKNFIKQLKFLKKFCNVVSVEDFLDKKFDPLKINVALTFDDGYANNYINALPILEEFNVPATFFVTGINTLNLNYLWADFIEIYQSISNKNFKVNEIEFEYKNNTFYQKNTNYSIHNFIKFIQPDIEFKQTLFNSFDKKIKNEIFEMDESFWRVMTDDEIIKCSKSKLISIQSHGMFHNNLGSIAFEKATQEISESKNYLENLTQKEVNAIGYPDGSYTIGLIDYCEKNGIKNQFATDYYLHSQDLKDERIKNRKGIFDLGSYKNQIYNSLKFSNKIFNSKKKIVHIIPCLAGGGAEILVGQIAIEQANQGYEVHIIQLEKEHHTYKNYPLKKEIENKVQIHNILCDSKFSLIKKGIKVNNVNFLKLLNKINPNVIHSHLFKSEIISRTYFKKNCVFISHLHDNMWQFDHKSKKDIKNKFIVGIEKNWLLDKYILNKNKFISISSDTTNYFNKVLPKKLKSNIFELNNAINMEQFCSKERTTLGKKIKFISVGNLVQKKGHDLLIDIFTIIKYKYHLDFQLDILGFGALHAQLASKIEKNGLEKHIFLRGNVNNVNEYLEKSDIYIHTASYEPFGMVFLEAMASGLPIISSNGKGNKSLVKSDFNGFLIDSREPEEYVNRILEMINDEKKYNQFSKNALEYIEKFDIKVYVKKLTEIYFNQQ